MTDSAIYQQSKRLAGMSITNSSGNKVSILNDAPLDLDKATIKSEYEALPPIGGYPEHGLPPLRSPRSPSHFRDRHNSGSSNRDYFSEDRSSRDPYYTSSHAKSSSSHRYRSESYEAGRSTSLTNAATPFRSGFDSRPSDAAANSQRSRSLSSGAQLYPYSSNNGMHSPPLHVPAGASPVPYFLRAFSEDNTSEEHEAYRGLIGHPGLPEGLLTGPSFSKRKYSCTHPGCNKRFTTSGHLARHNRIHTGERNFSCLMPGCPSKFSRQDNMMQHYRTHISPKSRRGTASKKQDQDENSSASATAVAGASAGAGDMDESDAIEHPSEPLENSHSPPAYNSRQSSPPQTETMEHDDYPAEKQRSSSMRQQEAMSRNGGNDGEQNHWPVPASPTSPMTHGVERMGGGEGKHGSSRDQQLFYYRQQQQYQQQYQNRHYQKQQQQQASSYYYAAQAQTNQGHGGYSHGHHNSSKHMASPPSSSSSSSAELHPQAYSYPHSHTHSSSDRPSLAGGRATGMSTFRNSGMTPPSPQSTPVTPTKYRFDPIQDCLQQERRQREEATL
ncbi:hypothetical protein BGX21_010190 [Mortierella sp. AD011]|nr:hypothetical protein BGX20_007154 [Mortierella sp. AD010]KAF9402404.1 hypothetical protein BGX21_010190 [Mortierella sp. AD011]